MDPLSARPTLRVMGLDVLMIVLMVAFFAFAAALVVWLDWI
jgi:hypothetical protein